MAGTNAQLLTRDTLSTLLIALRAHSEVAWRLRGPAPRTTIGRAGVCMDIGLDHVHENGWIQLVGATPVAALFGVDSDFGHLTVPQARLTHPTSRIEADFLLEASSYPL